MSLISSASFRRATAAVAAIALFATPISPAFAQVDDASSTPATSTAPVLDTTAPVITLLGDATVDLTVGDSYTDAGATATDDTDGDLTSSIVTTGSVDTSAAGTSTIAYDVSDAAGNKAAEAVRTVVVAAGATTTDDDTATTTDSDDGSGAPSVFSRIFSLFSAPSSGTIYYVDTVNGQDSNDGSAADPAHAFKTLEKAVSVANDDDTIDMTGTEALSASAPSAAITVSKAVTIDGQNTSTLNVSGTGYAFLLTGGATIENFAINKTDSANQNVIGIQANDITIDHNTFTGTFNIGNSETTRAMEVSGVQNVTISNNHIEHFRQPAYINNATGSVTDNYVASTKGWVVVSESNITFTGNTWGSGADQNAIDIAIIADNSGANPTGIDNYAGQTAAMSAANNNARIDEQVTPPPPTPTTVTVKPSNMNNWYFYNDEGDAVLSPDADHGFATGPGTPPAGTGSAHLTKTNTDKYGIATAQFAGMPLSGITALSFATYRTSGTNAQAPSLGFDVDSDTTDGNTHYEGRLTYEPYFTQTVNTGEWQDWNTLDDSAGAATGNWWFSHSTLNGGASQCTQANPCTWSELLHDYPHAAISGQLILRTNGADGEASDGNVDDLRLATASADTTYDFDPDPVVTPTLAITAPAAEGDTASGTYDFTADYENGVTTSLQWAVKTDPACNSGTIAGNVDGHHDASTLSGADFSASLDTTAWTNGTYCFVVNDGHSHRATRHFSVDNVAPDTESPTVTVTPAAGAVLHGAETFDITVSDNEPLDPSKNTHVWVYIYNGGGTSGTSADLSSGHATVILDTTKLSDGAATLDVGVVSDAAGNPTRDQYHPNGIDSYFSGYVVDNTGPTVSVAPAAGSALSGTVTFTVTVTDPHLDPGVLGHIWTYLYNNLPPQASKGASLDLSSGTATFTVDTTQLANGTSTLDVGKLYDALGNPSGAGDSYFKNYVIQNYTYSAADSKFTADPEYIRANNSGDTSSIALVPAAAVAARFTYTQTDGTGVYDDVAGAEHIQAGQFPVPSTGQHQYRGGVSAGAGVYTVTGEYEVGGTWYPITGSATLYVLGNPTGSFIIPNSSGAVFRPGDNPLRVKADDANSTFSRVTFAVDGTNYTVNRADCDLRAAGNYVLCDAKAAGNWPAAGLSAGTHTASATLYNQANNHAALAPVTFTVDGAAPAVTDFTTDMPTPGTLALSAVATDDQGIASVAFSITTPRAGDGVCDGNGVPLASATVTSGTGDTYAASLDDSALPSGTYCANVVAGDVAANHSHPQSLKIDIDHTAPTTPENGQPNETVLATNNFTFTWDASTDASGPVTYDYQATQNPAETDGVLTNGLWTPPAPLTVPSIASSGAGDGAWYWQVRAKDAAGNYSDWSPIWNVTLDTTAPAAPALFSPADGATVNGASVTQEWSDSDPTVDHYVYESYDDAAATSLRFTGTYPTTSKTATNVGDTTFWWRVAAVDAAGNQSAWSPLWQLTVDNASGLGHPTNTPPVADNQTVEVTQGEAFDITLTGSDADHDALTFAAAAPAHGTLTASSTNPAVVTYTADADYAGTDSFTFTANDGTEDSAAATVGITVDTAASTNSTTHHFSAKTKSQGTSGGSVLGAETFNFTRDLTIGSTGDDVTALQQILIDAGLLNIPAPTGYFGPLTRAALAFFQRLHGIVPAVGYFGPITRALLNGGSF